MDIKRPKAFFSWPESTERVFKGKIFDVYQWQQPLFDGETATFENLKRADTAEVIPVLPDGRILLIKQQQPATATYISTVAGRLEEGEGPFEGIKRELLEETGYEAAQWELWDAYQPVRKIDWVVYMFIAKGLTKVAGQNLDGGEKIEMHPVPFEEFMDLAAAGDIVGGKALAEVCMAFKDPAKKEELRKRLSV